MKKITVLMAAVLAVATVLAAGLTVLPASVQEAQANPCSNNLESEWDSQGNNLNQNGEQDCDFTGAFEFDED
ncbi:MAG: hypothetical protein ACRD42_05240 [Nitrososphaeraceae archaeon]